MATTKIWAVKSRMDHVLEYAANGDKTALQWSEADLQSMRDVMDYAMNDAKTEKQFYVTSLRCDLPKAREQMARTKRVHRKEDGILAFHGYQSFKPGEVTPDVAHEIGVKLAEELWPDYQVIVATHLDRAHIHNHFVLNSVSIDGRKFNATKTSYKEMRIASDRLCKQYGLSVITEQKATLKKHYNEWAAENDGVPTWRSFIRQDMDEAVKASMTYQQFINNMKQKGYVFEYRGSFLRLKAKGMQRFVRLRSLGTGYSESDIQRRILQKRYPEIPKRKTYAPPRKATVHGDFRLSKITWKGLRALYYFYVRKLRATAAHPHEPYPFVLKDDLRNLNAISEQAKFLSRYSIDTGEQIEALKQCLSHQLSDLQKEQKDLFNAKRRKGIIPEQEQELQQQTARLNAALRQVRKDLKLCDAVLERSLLIAEKNKVLQEQKQMNSSRVQQRAMSFQNHKK